MCVQKAAFAECKTSESSVKCLKDARDESAQCVKTKKHLCNKADDDCMQQ